MWASTTGRSARKPGSGRMHGNGDYVKSAWIGIVTALAFASPARAEVVTSAADRGLLAVAADGTPYVGFTVGGELHVASRSGRWAQARVARLPGTGAVLAGMRVLERPRRQAALLAEDRQGRWIALVRGSRLTTIARAAPGSSFGPAGLTLDAAGRPAVAYAVRRDSGKTFLRLVTFDRSGRTRVRAITKKGFPSSGLAPGAAPVLVGGRLHVVETYTSAAIDWAPARGGGWEGQYIFASVFGSPQGRVGAVFLTPTLWAAWTQVYPDAAVVLTSSAATQMTWTLTHGIFVTLAPGEDEPEVAANDWVTLGDDWIVYAGLVVRGPGSAAWQLDGRLEDFAVDADGGRQLLLVRDGVLEWFRAPAPALPGIQVRLGPVDGAGRLAGTVVAARGGAVELYRERPHAPRELVATVPVAADGSFQFEGLDAGVLYRAVYVDPATGIPFGLLPGVPVGVSD